MDIIVLEDDYDTREIITIILRNEGHRVSAFEAGQPVIRLAAELARARRGIDVLLSDYGLPDVDGMTTAKLVRKRLPGCRCYVITGWERWVGKAYPWLSGPVLAKPIQLEQLLTIVEGKA